MRVIYTTASWCQPCKKFGPMLERVAAEFQVPVEKYVLDEMTFSEINANEYTKDVKSVPNVKFILKDQLLYEEVTGAISEGLLRVVFQQGLEDDV